MSRSLLLISTSAVHGTPYLEHAFGELRDFLGGARRVLFIPHALKDHEGYARKARTAFESIGYGLDSLHDVPSRLAAVEQAEAVVAGGGPSGRRDAPGGGRAGHPQGARGGADLPARSGPGGGLAHRRPRAAPGFLTHGGVARQHRFRPPARGLARGARSHPRPPAGP